MRDRTTPSNFKSYPLLLLSISPSVYYSLPTTNTTPYLPPKCLPIVYFALPISSIALLLTLQRTVLELRIRPINLIRLILFFPLFPYLSNSIYIGEKKGAVSTIFSGPSAAYKPDYRCCFRYFRCFYYFRRCFSLHSPPPYTARTDLAATCYSPPYYGPVRY
jgi:hypothetical protein